VNETSTQVRGKWVCLYGAIEDMGRINDFLPSAKWDAVAARRFLQRAPKPRNEPDKATDLMAHHLEHVESELDLSDIRDLSHDLRAALA